MSRAPLFSALKRLGDINIIEYKDYDNAFSTSPDEESVTLFFIASGGTEELFLKLEKKLPPFVILLCDGYHNSLAAGFEISSWLEQKGIEHELINVPMNFHDLDFLSIKIACLNLKNLLSEFTSSLPAEAPVSYSSPDQIYSLSRVHNLLSRSVIGLIGGESSWLISSHIDRNYVQNHFGAQFVDIDIREVIDDFTHFQGVPDIPSQFEKADFPDREEIIKALKLYEVLLAICHKYSLTALTIKCFDMISDCHSTTCLALSMLNDHGITAGCEGDIPALWSMIVGEALSGKKCFMCNPASSCDDENTLDLAHCTVPLSLVSSFTLMSHFESRTGIGIAGRMILGEYSIMKIGGEHLDKMFKADGMLIANTNIPQRCRTQVRFHFLTKEDFDHFFSCRLGNHMIITTLSADNE